MNSFQRIAACALILAAAPATWAAGKGMSEAQRQYNEERKHCLSGQSHQDRATCLKEAGAAYQEARRGGLSGSTAGNATARCSAQPPADREACIQRVTGAGSSEGSVKGGGIIRQTETPVKN